MQFSGYSGFLENDLVEHIDICPDRRADNVCGDTVSGVHASAGTKLDQRASHGVAAFGHRLDLEIIQLIVMADDLLDRLECRVDGAVADTYAPDFFSVFLRRILAVAVITFPLLMT